MNNNYVIHDLPLHGVRVLELVSGNMRYASRLLADLGAEVLHVVSTAEETTHTGGQSLSRDSLETALLNRGKRIQHLDLSQPSSTHLLLEQLETVDIFIEDISGDIRQEMPIDISALRQACPELIVVSVSGFGLEGSCSSWQYTDPVLHALSGVLARSGIPEHPPLLPPAALAEYCASAQAAFIALLGFYDRLKSGQGAWFDFSILDGAVQNFDPGFGVAGSAAAGAMGSSDSRDRPNAGNRYPIIPCADGYVRICLLSPRQWRGMFTWMESPAEFAAPAFDHLITRFSSPTLLPAIAHFFADKHCERLEREGQEFGVPIASVRTPEEVVSTEQNRACQAFSAKTIAPGIEVPVPQGAIVIDGRRATSADLPLDNGVRSTLLKEAANVVPLQEQHSARRPLEGLRVLDLGVIVVGAETGRLLADAGADVVKVENAAFPDGLRQTKANEAISPSFAAGHRNKRSLSIDLRHPDGKALFRQLVECSDVLLSNFKPGTLDSLGFDDETLREINPKLIMIDSSAFGQVGPASRQLGYGPLVRAATGITAEWCYPGEPGSYSDAITVYPDHTAARFGAVTALALLIRRQRTGAGGSGSISQAEIIYDHLAFDIAIQELAKTGVVPNGVERDAPWGVYPCNGDDEWCVVSIRNDEDWQRLSGIIGLANQAQLATRSGRIACRDTIEKKLINWLLSRSPAEAMMTLQTEGIPASKMLRVNEMPDFLYYKERGFYTSVSHPHLSKPMQVETRPVTSPNLADPPNLPAPLMGEHSAAILHDWLSLPEQEINALLANNIIATANP